MSDMFGRILMAGGVLLVAATPPATAQEARRAAALLAGPSQYDLSGTGTTWFASARLDLPVGPFLLVEPGLSYLPYETQAETSRHHVLPEVQLQVEHPGRTFRPYLGVGVGASLVVRTGENELDGTLSGAGGIRVRTESGWTLRGELRVRVIDPWTGTTADWGVGVGRSF